MLSGRCSTSVGLSMYIMMISLISSLLKRLFEMSIQSLIVEGGAKLLQSFINAGLWDEARLICNEQLMIGNGLYAPALTNTVLQSQEQYLSDKVSYFRNTISSF